MSRYTGNQELILTEIILQEIKENIRESVFSNFPKAGKYKVIYGFDHACGYFIQFENLEIDGFSLESDIFTDVDSFFDKLSGAELGYVLSKVCSESYFLSNHIGCCYFDLEF